MFGADAVQGTCRVICFSPRHDLTLAKMPTNDIKKSVDLWAEQVSELGRKYRWVQIFKNRWEIMGALISIHTKHLPKAVLHEYRVVKNLLNSVKW